MRLLGVDAATHYLQLTSASATTTTNTADTTTLASPPSVVKPRTVLREASYK